MPRPRSLHVRARILIAVVASVLASLLLTAPGLATVEGVDDQLQQAEQREAEAQAELDVLSAEAAAVRDELVALEARLADAEARLRTLDGQVALAAGEVEQRDAVAADAASAAAAAAERLTAVEAELVRQERLLGDQLAIAWIHGSTSGPGLVYELLKTSSSPSDVAADLYRIEAVLDGQASIVGDVEQLRSDQVVALDTARVARAEADAAQQEAAQTLVIVQGLRAEAAAVRVDVATDRDRQGVVLASLEADADQARVVLASVRAEQDRLEAERQAVLAAEEERRRREQEQRQPSGGGGTASTGPCAVDGARAGRDFTNDWGFPRPGGRSHEGTDIFADRGTPVRSVGDGAVKELRATDTGLGGLYVSIWTGPGEHWYYAHLDSIAPGLAPGVPVTDGQQIGTVGNTGNARTTPPHLHIGHYFDDVAENPYPILEGRCR